MSSSQTTVAEVEDEDMSTHLENSIRIPRHERRSISFLVRQSSTVLLLQAMVQRLGTAVSVGRIQLELPVVSHTVCQVIAEAYTYWQRLLVSHSMSMRS